MEKTPTYHNLLADFVEQEGSSERADPLVLADLGSTCEVGVFRTTSLKMLPNGQCAVYMVYGKKGRRPLFWQQEIGRFRNLKLAEIVARYHRKVCASALSTDMVAQSDKNPEFGHGNDHPMYSAN